MEGREGKSSGVAEASGSYHSGVVRSENPNPNQGGVVALAVLPVSVGKKKRGRPRKYGPDGSILPAMPAPAGGFPAAKRGRGRPAGSVNRQQLVDLDSPGEWIGGSVGVDFMPHVITVAAGEDVTTKIISFSQQAPRAICILSANGAISNVTLRQPDSSGGTLTYEGRFELLSLSGSFMPTESGGTRSRAGGLSVSLASPDGRVVGGGVAGQLVAATPVQVVVGSFIPNIPQEQKPRKPQTDSATTALVTAAIPISRAEMEEAAYGGTQKPSLAPSSSFRGDNWASLHSLPDSRNLKTDINISLPGE
ncbi:AT-hook motif nuclear-localized protein 1-like [Tasmannia lanceolata]|uniref:AT-hook motif nuclear-localized protein 1-like n=1 Tax=Tasmannia lanceolata TaxID=3420 RepID=UPI004064BB27